MCGCDIPPYRNFAVFRIEKYIPHALEAPHPAKNWQSDNERCGFFLGMSLPGVYIN